MMEGDRRPTTRLGAPRPDARPDDSHGDEPRTPAVPHGRGQPAKRARTGVVLAVGYLVALLVSAGLAAGLGGFGSGFAGSDEPSHFVNALFVSRYLRDGFGQNPLAAAFDFYLHYPKFTIGQWPPLYYGLVGLVFLAVPASHETAMLLNAVVVALPALFVAWAALRLVGPVAAVAAAAWYATLPIVLHAGLFFMTDQAVTAWVLATAAAWLAYVARGTLPLALLCAGCAAAGILTKGNAWQVGLVPPLHMLLLGDWAPLRNWRTYAAGAVACVALVPWYLVTLGGTAGSWMEQPGLDYAARAAGVNLSILLGNLGVGLALAAVGLAVAWRARARAPAAWRLAALCASVVAANFLFQLALPAGLEERFLAPALPPLVALAAAGGRHVVAWVLGRTSRLGAAVTAALLAAVLVAPGLHAAWRRDPKVDLRLAEVAHALMAGETADAPAIWVVDGPPGAEGALVAEVAARDDRGMVYVARTTTLLSDSNWTGQSYRLRVTEPSEAARVLRELGAGIAVLVRRDDDPVLPHNALLETALIQPGSGWALARRLPHRHRPGVTLVYVADPAPRPDLDRLRRSVSARAQSLGSGVTHR